MSRAVLRVAEAGPLVTVQDAGRHGAARFGVTASGPMDGLAFRAANAALGNPSGQPAVEVSVGGLRLECREGPVTIAVAGGGFRVSHGAAEHASWTVLTLREGDTLSVRPGFWGSWAYLAFAGRLGAHEWLGSTSTHAPSGFGGGRLRAEQDLVVAEAEARTGREGPIAFPANARPPRAVRVVTGPQDRFFSADTLARFLSETFTLSDAYDRMGVRLRGPPLPPSAPLDMPSEAVARGSVQVAGDGVATVLLADHQTTGGYPKIATVIGPDLDGFAQLRSRGPIRFRASDPEEAVRAARSRHGANEAYLARLRDGRRPA